MIIIRLLLPGLSRTTIPPTRPMPLPTVNPLQPPGSKPKPGTKSELEANNVDSGGRIRRRTFSSSQCFRVFLNTFFSPLNCLLKRDNLTKIKLGWEGFPDPQLTSLRIFLIFRKLINFLTKMSSRRPFLNDVRLNSFILFPPQGGGGQLYAPLYEMIYNRIRKRMRRVN